MAARRVLLLDDDAEHQIRIVLLGAEQLGVSCVCRSRGGLLPLATWPGVLPLADALAVYMFHVERSERLAVMT